MFIEELPNISQFKWRNISLLYWLYQIATNELNKYFNAHKYRPHSLCRIQEEYGIDITDRSSAETESIKLQDELDKHQDFMKINACIRKMDIKYGEVISLRFFENKSINEIAIILNKKEGTIKSLLSRGVEKLKENIKS